MNTPNLYSQRTCGTDTYQQELMLNPEYQQWFEKTTHLIRERIKVRHTKSGNIVRVPVAIHFNGAVTNENICCLIDASIAQIEVLNQDFGADNADIEIYTDISDACPHQFPVEALFEGTHIEFYIATSNHPIGSGLSEGEYAITIGQESFPNAGSEWSGYLNIFVEDDLGYLGSAPISGAVNPNGNGIHILASAFGGPGISCFSGTGINTEPNYDLGRTVTHEVGHYFGLRHIFSGCGNGDMIDDTPDQNQSNLGVPTMDFTTCTSTANNSCGTRDFYMNYMDYVDDISMVMFTTDQGAVMDVEADHNMWRVDVGAISTCGEYLSPEFTTYQALSVCPFISVDLNTFIRSIIGGQVHEGNEFVGGNALAESQPIASFSPFFVNSTYPFHLPANPSPADWFINEPNVHNYYECASAPGPNWMPFWDDEDILCAYYTGVVADYGYESKEYIRLIQSMLRYGWPAPFLGVGHFNILKNEADTLIHSTHSVFYGCPRPKGRLCVVFGRPADCNRWLGRNGDRLER